MKYLVNNSDKKLAEIDQLEDLIKKLVIDLKLEDSYFSVIIVSDEEIHEINHNYRGIDRPTDVISFALEDDESSKMDVRVLGDIFISIDRAIDQSREYGHSLKRELSFLLVHGLLHLLGYDHMDEADEQEMFNKQKEILDKYEIQK